MAGHKACGATAHASQSVRWHIGINISVSVGEWSGRRRAGAATLRHSEDHTRPFHEFSAQEDEYMWLNHFKIH